MKIINHNFCELYGSITVLDTVNLHINFPNYIQFFIRDQQFKTVVSQLLFPYQCFVCLATSASGYYTIICWSIPLTEKCIFSQLSGNPNTLICSIFLSSFSYELPIITIVVYLTHRLTHGIIIIGIYITHTQLCLLLCNSIIKYLIAQMFCTDNIKLLNITLKLNISHFKSISRFSCNRNRF